MEKDDKDKTKKKKQTASEPVKILGDAGCEPLKGMASIADDAEVDVKLRAKLYMELAQYLYPKKRGAENEDGSDTESYEEKLRKIKGLDED
ncbi:hypothetical protein MCHI_003372 [Candidatus Magnetoovum chiemensis]|nr:hypothetical protein MCHI_003372 [Candidatus Magnetoovum chiemensis]